MNSAIALRHFPLDPRRLSDRITTYGLFIDPPLGRVGMSEAQARGTGRKVLIGKMQMARVGRARERSETLGFLKVLIDSESEKILGATILGIGGDEVIHSIIDVMYGIIILINELCTAPYFQPTAIVIVHQYQ